MKAISYYTIRIQSLPNHFINALMIMNNAPNIFKICIAVHSVFFLFASTPISQALERKQLVDNRKTMSLFLIKSYLEYLKKRHPYFSHLVNGDKNETKLFFCGLP